LEHFEPGVTTALAPGIALTIKHSVNKRANALRFIPRRVLTLGGILKCLVHNYPVIELTSRGGPKIQWQRQQERELCSSADELSRKELK
jgi:hypothetical protein